MAQKVTLITGCSSGIGLAIAARLARDKAKQYTVIPTMRDVRKRTDLDEAVGGSLDIRQLDCLQEDSMKTCVQDVLQEYGRIDVLINNAGIASLAPVESLSMEDIRRTIDTNLLAPISLTQKVLPLMLDRGSGHILNISSISGIHGFPFYDIYGATKSALHVFTESLSSRCRQLNVQVACIEMGPVATNINQNIILPDFDNIRHEPTMKQFRNTMSWGKMIFRTAIVSPESIAEVTQRVLEENSGEVRYQVGQYANHVAAMTYRDVTSLRWMEESQKMFSQQHDDEFEFKKLFGILDD